MMYDDDHDDDDYNNECIIRYTDQFVSDELVIDSEDPSTFAEAIYAYADAIIEAYKTPDPAHYNLPPQVYLAMMVNIVSKEAYDIDGLDESELESYLPQDIIQIVGDAYNDALLMFDKAALLAAVGWDT